MRPTPLVMNGRLFRDSLIVIGLTLIGSLFFSLLFIGLWYYHVRKKNKELVVR